MSCEEESVDPTANKVVLIGNEGVGKTSIFLRFKTDRFIEPTSQTRYQAEHYKEWNVARTPVKMTLFDTAGMERYTSTVPPTYFRNAKQILMVYSIDNPDSISDVIMWAENFSLARLGESSNQMTPILVGNKSDLEDSRDISVQRVQETARLCGISEEDVFEISTSTGEGFEEMFDKLALKMAKSENGFKRQKTIRAGSDVRKDKQKSITCSNCSKQ